MAFTFMQFYQALQEFNEWRALKVKRIDGYDLDLRQFCIFVKNKSIEDVNINDVTEWIGWYKNLGFEPWTVLKKAMALRKFFEYYGRRKYHVLDHWLIPMPAKTYNMPRVCNEENYKKLLKAIPKNGKHNHMRNRCLINIAWDTGARIGEIVALNIADVDLQKKTLIIKTEKSRGMRPFRKLPFGKETKTSLKKWLDARKNIAYDLDDTDALFIGLRSKSGMQCVRLASSAASEIFRKYSNKANLPYINAHSLRHHFGSDLAKRGFNNSVISEALGHSQLASSYQYTQIQNDDLNAMLRKRLR